MTDTINEEGGSCCPICLESLLQRPSSSRLGGANDESLQIGATVPCGHCFHTKCWKKCSDYSIRRRRSNLNKCPTCNVTIFSFMRLFLNAPGTIPATVPMSESSTAQPPPVSDSLNAAPSLGTPVSTVPLPSQQAVPSVPSPTEPSGWPGNPSFSTFASGQSMASQPSRNWVFWHPPTNGAFATASPSGRVPNPSASPGQPFGQVPATIMFPRTFQFGSQSSTPLTVAGSNSPFPTTLPSHAAPHEASGDVAPQMSQNLNGFRNVPHVGSGAAPYPRRYLRARRPPPLES